MISIDPIDTTCVVNQRTIRKKLLTVIQLGIILGIGLLALHFQTPNVSETNHRRLGRHLASPSLKNLKPAERKKFLKARRKKRREERLKRLKKKQLLKKKKKKKNVKKKKANGNQKININKISEPTPMPSTTPSRAPTNTPTNTPSKTPSNTPTTTPTSKPTNTPSNTPTNTPTNTPSTTPTNSPTTTEPSVMPSMLPTSSTKPTTSNEPSSAPFASPSSVPSNSPSLSPSSSPTYGPSSMPSTEPSRNPTLAPSSSPSSTPTALPSLSPSGEPTTSSMPSLSPSTVPSSAPTDSFVCGGLTREERDDEVKSTLLTLFPTGLHEEAENWIVHEDTRALCSNDTTLEQRYILSAFYFDANGEGWAKGVIGGRRWLSWKSECDWYGITCNEFGFIRNINLDSNNMTGTISETIESLSSFRVLDVSTNALSGPFPPLPASMHHVVLHHNSFSGPLPDSWPKKMTHLLINHNKFSGSINSLSTMTFARFLQLHRNEFSGTISIQFGSLTDLEILTLHKNELSGSIPDDVCLLRNIVSPTNVLSTLTADCDESPTAKVHCNSVALFGEKCCTSCK